MGDVGLLWLLCVAAGYGLRCGFIRFYSGLCVRVRLRVPLRNLTKLAAGENRVQIDESYERDATQPKQELPTPESLGFWVALSIFGVFPGPSVFTNPNSAVNSDCAPTRHHN